jgi:hypothetical protein
MKRSLMPFAKLRCMGHDAIIIGLLCPPAIAAGRWTSSTMRTIGLVWIGSVPFHTPALFSLRL